ncbi:hypothetical protein G647_10426 [Cladophialophora carrionii CBS 160.54]|uniref:Uncharacterized protein n=1 Tax=Cladophialophora carrionii CBS 160.54 TaxID=1279043 RepID=V9DKZ5_9EURO|nr:uncharacterized protein G647_10426 [Cladophialophora carrionii CBS 160.54]ETI26612.1 hypothetical protein G647_10426 [Cladophialophora carrionii CBS 160.54]
MGPRPSSDGEATRVPARSWQDLPTYRSDRGPWGPSKPLTDDGNWADGLGLSDGELSNWKAAPWERHNPPLSKPAPTSTPRRSRPAKKHTAVLDLDDDEVPEKSAKRRKDQPAAKRRRPGITFDILCRLRPRSPAPLCLAVLVSLCAYLHTIIRLGCEIDGSTFNRFILDHSTFQAAHLDGSNDGPAVSYHTWFLARDLPPEDVPSVVSVAVLEEMSAENPYTFRLIERLLMKAIRQLEGLAVRRGARARRSPRVRSRRGADHAKTHANTGLRRASRDRGTPSSGAKSDALSSVDYVLTAADRGSRVSNVA